MYSEYTNLLDNYDAADFEKLLQKQLESLDIDFWQLDQESRYTGIFETASLSFSILSAEKKDDALRVKLGIYFQEMLTPCPCSGEENQLSDGFCQRILVIENDSIKLT